MYLQNGFSLFNPFWEKCNEPSERNSRILAVEATPAGIPSSSLCDVNELVKQDILIEVSLSQPQLIVSFIKPLSLS